MKQCKVPSIKGLVDLHGNYPQNYISQISVESTAVASNIKREAGFSIELFDNAIREAVNEFYEFSAVYREGNADKFIEDVRTLDNILSDSNRKFSDAIRWSDDENYVI